MRCGLGTSARSGCCFVGVFHVWWWVLFIWLTRRGDDRRIAHTAHSKNSGFFHLAMPFAVLSSFLAHPLLCLQASGLMRAPTRSPAGRVPPKPCIDDRQWPWRAFGLPPPSCVNADIRVAARDRLALSGLESAARRSLGTRETTTAKQQLHYRGRRWLVLACSMEGAERPSSRRHIRSELLETPPHCGSLSPAVRPHSSPRHRSRTLC